MATEPFTAVRNKHAQLRLFLKDGLLERRFQPLME